MDYENKYKEALERVRVILTDRDIALHAKEKFIDIFPELKESEDERIRKELIAHCRNTRCVTEECAEQVKNWIAWLEKQDEQKPTDKTELKFNIGDWIVGNDGIFKITRYEEEYGYELTGTTGYVAHFISPDYVESNFHLWTIVDAKEGDVLYSLDSKQPFIYKGRPQFSQARGYCCINKFGEFAVWNTIKCVICTDKYIPATKGQRDTLFAKMKEAGYEWDAEKKEVKKIDVKTLDPDKVIEWLEDQACQGWFEDIEVEKFVDKFKKDFGL